MQSEGGGGGRMKGWARSEVALCRGPRPIIRVALSPVFARFSPPHLRLPLSPTSSSLFSLPLAAQLPLHRLRAQERELQIL